MKLFGFLLLLEASIILIIFHNWLSLNLIAGGDFLYVFPQILSNLPPIPFIWDYAFNNGLGGNTIFLYPLNLFFNSTAFLLSKVNLEWNLIERIVWFWPFLLISLVSSYSLFKKLFKNSNFSLLSSLIFSLNTYSLIVVGGGQLGVGLAYSITPAVFLSFHSILESKNKLRLALLSAFVFSFQVLIDLRIAYVTAVGIAIYYLVFIAVNGPIKSLRKTFLYFGIIPGLIILGLHFFWMYPFIKIGQDPLVSLGGAFTSKEAVNFFSFANFENTISLLHPYWPENIFGKIGFMKPEFILIPVLAFSSLLLVAKEKKEQTLIISFTLISLLGAFLAKGTNLPFGNVYLFLFNHLPLFEMFRDSTKWFVLVAIGYCVLIPYSILKIYQVISSKFSRYLGIVFIFLVISYLLFLIRPALLQNLTGTFTKSTFPSDYEVFTSKLGMDSSFYRTLWIPKIQTYSFSSFDHPAVGAQDLFSEYDSYEVFDSIDKPTGMQKLRDIGVRYLIIPYDSSRQIFVSDRKYNENVYQNYLKKGSEIPGVVEIAGFDKLKVFEIQNYRGLFYIYSSNNVRYEKIDNQNFKVSLEDVRAGDKLIFNELYDKGWNLIVDGKTVTSSRAPNGLNFFTLEKNGSYDAYLTYSYQRLLNYSSIISLFTIIISLGLLVFSYKNGRIGSE